MGDLVLRKCRESRKDAKEGKLVAKWEGLFKVTESLGNEAY